MVADIEVEMVADMEVEKVNWAKTFLIRSLPSLPIFYVKLCEFFCCCSDQAFLFLFHILFEDCLQMISPTLSLLLINQPRAICKLGSVCGGGGHTNSRKCSTICILCFQPSAKKSIRNGEDRSFVLNCPTRFLS